MAINIIMRAALLLHTAAAYHLPIAPGSAASSRASASAAMLADGGPSFWDKLKYGQSGKPAPPAPPPPPAPTLAALFAQLDTNNDGVLQRQELRQALRVVGLPEADFDPILDAVCGEAECPLTFEAFDARLPEEARARLISRLTEEGVLPSLYTPPETWIDTKTDEAIRWQNKVQGDARRYGNQLKQNDILNDQLGGQ